MRIVSRTRRSVREQERERAIREREAAGTLIQAFPATKQVRIHLQFVSAGGPTPAARTHALYPPAQAYFVFACPHGDCDGSIDLNTVANALLRKGGSRADGTLHCPGTRSEVGGNRPPCKQRVDYWIDASYQPIARAAV